MNHREVVELKNGIDALINHCIQRHIANYHLNYGLDKNQEHLLSSINAIDKATNKDLIEFEKKVWALAKVEIGKLETENKKLPNEDQLPIPKDVFGFGLNFVTAKERKQRIKWMEDYEEFMKEEDDFKIFLLNPDKVGELDIEYPYYKVLRKFLPEEVEQKEEPPKMTIERTLEPEKKE